MSNEHEGIIRAMSACLPPNCDLCGANVAIILSGLRFPGAWIGKHLPAIIAAARELRGES